MPPKRKNTNDEDKNKNKNKRKKDKKEDTSSELSDSDSSELSDSDSSELSDSYSFDSSDSDNSDLENTSDEDFICNSNSDDDDIIEKISSDEDEDEDEDDEEFIDDDEDGDDDDDDTTPNKNGILIIMLSDMFGKDFFKNGGNPFNEEEDDECCEDDGGGCDNNNNNPFTNLRKRRKLAPLPPAKRIKRTKIDIPEKITSIDDLLNVIEKYEDKPELEYTINMEQLKKLKEPLIELKNLIGLDQIKSQILDQIMFLLSQLRDADQMLHTCIYGSPGSGKTLLGTILAKIYHALGYSNGKFRIVKRSDLVAGYLGQTAIKTQKVINETKGGVLFIDEAYSLGNEDGRDSFSKEAIDTINQNLTELKTEIICIIAGYKEELDKCFFSMNPGLSRRFPFRYEIKEYDYQQLHSIFHSKIVLSGWGIDDIPVDKFKTNEKYFTQKGGDMETLSQMCKIAYSRRTFGKHQEQHRHLTIEDFDEGFKLYLNNDEVKNRPNNMDDHEKFFQEHIKPFWYA